MSKTYVCPFERIDYGPLSPPGCLCPGCGAALQYREPMVGKHKKALWGPMGVYGSVEVEGEVRLPTLIGIPHGFEDTAPLVAAAEWETEPDPTTERIRGLDFKEKP